ncbi:Aste57867_23067 [Aphanomyces stellatus]|uniref:Aste57867_23067 protein n=1 Tax=Aphanomyces stellatus TaxID=120398 RepID=A0A485LLX8_9STRA|nr:hypothetical protein As57867_022996 [Aphanomyces stellatus]VFT99715.1 Aste57867_23067 [Aphanomyces stellatus]
MASTTARKLRCHNVVGNGAIYLESALRNINSWPAWTQCWGASFDIAIAHTLNETTRGRGWLVQTMAAAVRTSVQGEVDHWLANHIQTFVLQWQNYKTVGMLDSVQIQNVFSAHYPITLSDTHGAYHLSQQTSLKMYWSFAGNLWAVSSSSTTVGGLSLLGSSPTFAFQNITSEQLLIENMTLVSPYTACFVAFEVAVDPFGAVDMTFVQAPLSLADLCGGVLGNLATLFVQPNSIVQSAFQSLAARFYIGEFPPALGSQTISLLGGNILCGGEMSPPPVHNTAQHTNVRRI